MSTTRRLGRGLRDLMAASGTASDRDVVAMVANVGDLTAAADQNGGRKLPTFSMAAYTGGRMRQWWSDDDVVLDLAGLDVTDKPRPILKDHNDSIVIGHTTRLSKSQSELRVEGVISGAGRSAQEVVEAARNGFPWQASVRTTVDAVEEVAAGATARANGQEHQGPVLIIRASRLREVSFVALGADDNTTASVAARRDFTPAQTGDAAMKEFEKWAQANGHDLAAATAEERKTLQASFKAEQKAADEPKSDGDPDAAPAAPDVKAAAGPSRRASGAAEADDDLDAGEDLVAAREKRAAEMERVHAIEVFASEHPKTARLAARAIREGWSTDRFHLEALQAQGSSVSGVRMDGASVTQKSLEAALCLSAGVPQDLLAKEYDERTLDAATAGPLQDAGFHTIIHACLRAAGREPGLGRMSDSMIREALQASDRMSLEAAAGHSTISLPTITGNIANKTMLAAFTSNESAAVRIAKRGSNPDFKTATRVRLTDTGELKKVNQGGEVEHGSASDTPYTTKVETRGKMLVVTREDIINDDLGAFLELPRLLGYRAWVSREKTTFETLLGGIGSHFSSGNGNYISGASTALSVKSLSKLRAVFRKFKDDNGDLLGLIPRTLLVPVGLEDEARAIIRSASVIDGTNTDRVGSANVHQGRFEVVASPYLDADSGLSNASDTHFFLFGDPMFIPAIEISYLRGREEPIVDTGNTRMDILGIEHRVIYDFGVDLMDTRGAAGSKGAA